MSRSPAVQPFEEGAAEYDRWFNDSPIFAMELATLHAFRTGLPSPRLEIGVGPGRFAQALGIGYGIDPALTPLRLARRRGIMVAAATGEEVPVRSATIGTAVLLFTLCFVANPAGVLEECARILRPEGRMLLGLIPRDSAWGRRLAERGRAGDPYYRHARFRTIASVQEMLTACGFEVFEAWSCLRQPPGKDPAPEAPMAGIDERAGFCALLASRQGA